MVESATGSDDLSSLLAQADSTPLARRHIETLANAAPVGRLTESLEQAIESAHLYASTILALAIGAAGGRISAHLAHQLIPDLEDMEYVPIIAGIIEGDRVAALLDLVADQRMSWEREALVLFLATRLLEGQEPPPRLITQLRTLAREPINPMIGIVVGFAAHELANSEIDALAADFLPMARAAAQRGVHDVMSRGLFSPVLDSIPEEAAPRVVSGYTVVRTEPKVGRNDPCPCGSGRKYKKCCADREHEVSSHPSRVEQFQKLGPRAGRQQEQIFDLMRPVELATLNPEQLTTIQLIKGMRKLSAHHRWDSAERFMDVLSKRTDSPGGNPDGYRVDLAYEAIKAGELDLAERQMALASPSEDELTRFGVRIALARKHPDALVRLESALDRGHNGDPLFLIDGAFALLDYFPALGILAARGCISADRLLDSEALLENVGRARDRLNLSAEEPWWDIFDLLLGEDFGPRHHPLAPGSGGDQQRIGQQQIEGLRAELQTANARVSRLSQELETRVHQLEEVSEEREKLATMVEAAHSDEDRKRVSDLEAERQRLRAKIGELKGEITEGGAQRAELRRELARTADDLRRQTPVQTPADPAEIDDHDEAESDTTVEHPRRILVPHFSTSASRSLNTVPTRVASGALHEVALLASGDAPAWSGAKHMRRAHDILSVRIGRTYRLLFRIADDRLDLLDLINRRDLDAAIHRLAGR